MKKLFLLIPALVLSLAINAEVINITPTSPHSANNLIAALQGANDGDVIILADGTYSENNNYIVFDKNVTVKAAEGAHPIVEVECFIKVQDNKSATIMGIAFDGSKQDATGANSTVYTHFIRVYTAGTLDLDNCEFYNIGNQVIEVAESTSHINNIKIDSCYFHDCTNSALYVKKGSDAHLCDRVEITNSTFANFSGFDAGVIAVSSKGEVLAADPADDYQMTVDHCTFYNCIKTANSTYGVIDSRKSTRITVSNCIFANPASIPEGTYASKATQLYGGTVTNCLLFNTPNHRTDAISLLNPLYNVDPLFNDLEHNKYTYDGIYGVSMSPARGASTDGSDLGDPRWYTPATYPATDFAAPGYYCSADAATLSGGASASKFYLNTEADPHHIIWKETAYNDNVATWHLTATRACEITVALDLGPAYSSNKHIYEVKILDANNNPVGTLAEDPADPDGVTENNVEADQIKTFDGSIIIPAAGDYTIELRNIRGYGKGTIKNIILKYVGDAPITDFSTPYACTADKATLSGGASASKFYLNTEADPHHIIWKETAYNDNVATWNLTATRACHVSVALDLGPAYSSNKHIFEVKILDSNNNPVGVLAEDPADPDGVTENNMEADQVKTFDGTINIPAAGDYIVELRNIRGWGKGTIKNIILSYAGGAVVEIPNDDIDLADAILSERAYRDADGLHFTDADHYSTIADEYAQWNIRVAADGVYKFTANCNSTNYSNLTIQVLQGGVEKYTYTPQYTYTGAKEIKSPEWFLAAGNYELQLSNPANHSNGYLVSLSAAAVEGILIVDEMATDMTYINDLNGQSRKPLLKRTFKGGMYNTICFPFNNVSDEELASIFGAGYELLELTSASLNGNELDLHFEAVDLTANTYGRPYLIKPTQDVTNPLFNSHTIYKSTSHLTKECDAADFIGSFIASEVPAGDQNLFLGQNDLLYFSQTATPIKGLRAYFHVKVPGAANTIKRARLVTPNNMPTEINLVNDENKAIKRIENGQVVIIRDGIRYNVMGVKLQ